MAAVKGAANPKFYNSRLPHLLPTPPVSPFVQFLIDNALLMATALASGALLAWPVLQRRSGAQVSAVQAVQLINREKAVLVDVGEPAEFDAQHANNARNIPFGQLEASKDLPSNKALPLVVLCPTGARAGRAVSTLKKLGYERACAVSGGTKGWADANLPLQRKA